MRSKRPWRIAKEVPDLSSIVFHGFGSFCMTLFFFYVRATWPAARRVVSREWTVIAPAAAASFALDWIASLVAWGVWLVARGRVEGALAR
jgi:hypothetical protein